MVSDIEGRLLVAIGLFGQQKHYLRAVGNQFGQRIAGHLFPVQDSHVCRREECIVGRLPRVEMIVTVLFDGAHQQLKNRCVVHQSSESDDGKRQEIIAAENRYLVRVVQAFQIWSSGDCIRRDVEDGLVMYEQGFADHLEDLNEMVLSFDYFIVRFK